jgi:hypothetical protein
MKRLLLVAVVIGVASAGARDYPAKFSLAPVALVGGRQERVGGGDKDFIFESGGGAVAFYENYWWTGRALLQASYVNRQNWFLLTEFEVNGLVCFRKGLIQPYVAPGIGGAVTRYEDGETLSSIVASGYIGLIARFPGSAFSYISFETGYRYSTLSYIPFNVFGKFRLSNNLNLLTSITVNNELVYPFTPVFYELRVLIGPEFYI